MIKRDIATWTRWLHIYLSMFSFAALLFFAVTGITLNHPDWLSSHEARTISSHLNPDWVKGTDTLSVNKLGIVEHFRDTYAIKARVSNFISDQSQCSLSFKGPGYSADAFIDRSTGEYELTIIAPGSIAILNDLHKGRDTRASWSWVIDISGFLMILVSLTGFIMIFYLKKKRTSGLLIFLLGTLICVILYWPFA